MPRKILRAYGVAVAAVIASVVLTRLAWPLFAPTPYAPAFAAVVLATQLGSPGAGLFTIALAVVGAFLTFPTSGVYPWQPNTAIVFVLVSLVGNRLIAARNRATAALRDSEAQLRATLDEVRASGEKLRRAQKMEAVGQLAARVAHNFNNLLTVTMVCADEILEHPGDAKLQRQAIEEIKKATSRGASLTRQLLAFGGKHDPRTARVDVDRAVDALREMLRRVVPENIKLTFDLGWQPAVVMVDPHDLEQVILNLVMNARDALPAGGAIHVTVAREVIDAGDARLGDSAAPGEYVQLAVRDNGTGMSPEAQSHLFEPFFTTKGPTKGTGVGLAFVSEIARHARGFVSVTTAPGKGTSISVYLAAAAHGTEMPAEESVRTSAASSRSLMILLVEDEDSVRETTAWVLRRAGHRVLPAATPIEGIALFGMYLREIDLLITDIVLPEMPGSALASELLATRRDLPVLFVSAYPDATPPRETTDRHMGFLAKPFSAATLLASIAELEARG